MKNGLGVRTQPLRWTSSQLKNCSSRFFAGIRVDFLGRGLELFDWGVKRDGIESVLNSRTSERYRSFAFLAQKFEGLGEAAGSRKVSWSLGTESRTEEELLFTGGLSRLVFFRRTNESNRDDFVRGRVRVVEKGLFSVRQRFFAILGF